MPNLTLYSIQPVLAEGLRVLLANSFQLTGAFLTLDALKEGLPAAAPDLLLIEANSFVSLETIRDLREQAPSAGIVLWVDGISSEFVSQALSLGVLGILSKTALVETMTQCLSSVARGELWIDGKLSARLLTSRNVHLTPREGQLMGLLAQGLSNKEIAWSLGITEGTVKVYLSRLFDKTGTCDRFELALLALRNLAPTSTGAAEESAARASARTVPFMLSSFIVKGPGQAAHRPVARPAEDPRPQPFPPASAGPITPKLHSFQSEMRH